MPRPKLVIPSIKLNVALPQDVYLKITAHLHSELEGRVPYGAYSKFLQEITTAYFRQQHLDLAPYSGYLPGGNTVSASPETMVVLKQLLETK